MWSNSFQRNERSDSKKKKSTISRECHYLAQCCLRLMWKTRALRMCVRRFAPWQPRAVKFLSLKTSPEQNSSAWETRPALQATDKSAADHGRTRRASSQSRPLFHCGGQRGRPATVCDAEDLQAPGNHVASKRSPPRWSHVPHGGPRPFRSWWGASRTFRWV